jgi:CRISPR/Cas system-associated endonuclease Cas3-HD
VASLECYAFKKSEENGGVQYETMEEHVGDMLKYLDEIWEYKAFLSKYKKILRVERDTLDLLIRLAVILHDFGKATRDAQERCNTSDCEHFPYHYAISARLAMKLADQLKDVPTVSSLPRVQSSKPSLGALYVSIVVLPILLHHYAWVSEESLLEAINRTRKLGEVEIYEPCRVFYVKSLGDLLKHSKSAHSELDEILRSALDLFSRSNKIKLSSLPLNRIEDLTSIHTAISLLVTLIEVSTGIINMCDGRVAKRNRE